MNLRRQKTASIFTENPNTNIFKTRTCCIFMRKSMLAGLAALTLTSCQSTIPNRWEYEKATKIVRGE